ncbi:MAG: recombinase family protein, partial [Terriglobales bacterium]
PLPLVAAGCQVRQANRGAALAEVFTDEGVSGGVSLDQRPGLLAALVALKDHDASVLLVAKRDRLARDVLVAAMVERLAERTGARPRSSAVKVEIFS